MTPLGPSPVVRIRTGHDGRLSWADGVEGGDSGGATSKLGAHAVRNLELRVQTQRQRAGDTGTGSEPLPPPTHAWGCTGSCFLQAGTP